MSAEQNPYDYFIEQHTGPSSEPLPAAPRESHWDPQAIGAYLDTVGSPIIDPVFAEGWEYPLDFTSKTLEVYPDRQTVIFKAPTMKVEWYQAEQPTLVNEPGHQGVTFVKSEHGELHNLVLSTSGEFILAIFPTGNGEVGTPLPQTHEEAAPTTPEKDPRVEISGRVGKDPILKKTVKGGDVLTFSVAVANGTEKPDWHKVVAFGERALALADTLHKGDKVDVIGYQARSTRMETDKKTGQQVEKQYTFVRVAQVNKPEKGGA